MTIRKKNEELEAILGKIKSAAEVIQVAEEYTDVDISEITLEELGGKELPLNVVSALGFMMK